MTNYEQGFLDKCAISDDSKLWDYLATAVSPGMGHAAMGAVRAPEGRRIPQALKGGLAGAGGAIGGGLVGGIGGSALGAFLGRNKKTRRGRDSLTALLGLLGMGTGGLIGGSELGRKVTKGKDVPEEEAPEEAPEEVAEEEAPEEDEAKEAYDQGFMDKCAARGMSEAQYKMLANVQR